MDDQKLLIETKESWEDVAARRERGVPRRAVTRLLRAGRYRLYRQHTTRAHEDT